MDNETFNMIETLGTAAGEAGDLLQAAICQIALYGEPHERTYRAMSRRERQTLRRDYAEGDGWRETAAVKDCLDTIAGG